MADIIDTSPHSMAKMTDVFEAINNLSNESGDYVKKSGDTLTGPLNQPLEPATDNELANKKYVDDTTSGGAAQIKRFEFTGSAGQTTIAGPDLHGEILAYTPDNIDVFVGGEILQSSDYTATTGNSIVLGVALTAGQKVKVNAYGIFAVANALAKAENLGDLPDPNLARVNIGLNATNTPFIPAGGLISANVQAALQEINDIKFSKSGGALTGDITFNGVGTNQIINGNGDAINYTTYNIGFKLWKGIAFLDSSNQVKGFVDTINGVLDMSGNIRVNGQNVWHSGNFDPNTKLGVNGGNLTGNISITKSDASLTLIDSFHQYKIHTANNSTPQLRFSFYNAAGTYISTPTFIQSDGNIWSTAFNSNYITNFTWNANNFNPNTKANVNGQTFTSDIGVASGSPQIFIERSGVRRWNHHVTSDGAWRLMDGGTIRVTADTSGNLYSQGNVGAYSDIKIKTNISTISNALEKTKKLRGVEYTRKDNGDRQIGVIAQEIQQVIPQVVMAFNNGEEDLLTVSYGNISALLIEAIKEIDAKYESKISELEEEIKRLKGV
ncbi:tail fiber receptor recognition protein [Ochrobactrum phage vB_OspM_OC]|nr:tail fiber receptor recognition protein [Ochrobactrum phage vB_OspM_OC]